MKYCLNYLSTPACLILAAISFLFMSCSEKERETYTLKPVNLDYTVLASCTVSDPEPYKVKVKAGGDIVELIAREGDRVEKGQLLARIDDFREKRDLIIRKNNLNSINLQIEDAKKNDLPRLEEQLKKDTAILKNSERYLNRLRTLAKTGGVSEVELEKAEEDYKQNLARYNQTEIEIRTFNSTGKLADLETERSIITAQIELSEKALDDKRIKAPYSGVITDVFFREGETVQDNSELLSIIEDREWEIEANIDQRDIPFVKISQDAFIILDAYPSIKIAAQVLFVCLDVDISRGSCLIKLKVRDRHDFIRYGMTGNVEIIADRFTDVLAVPSRFLKREYKTGYVYIRQDNGITANKTEYMEVGENWVILENIPENTVIYALPEP